MSHEEDIQALFSDTGFLPHPRMNHIDYFSAAEQVRTEELLAIPRYHKIEKMTHRTNDALHELRVTTLSVMASTMLLHLGVDHDQVEVIFKARHHDDAEIKTGDTPSPVKRNATPEERERMKEEEMKAIEELEWMIPKPKGFDNFAKPFGDYREQKGMVDRLINYWDKFDGLHEAIHEVICGDNPEAFKQVIREYEPTFQELTAANQDWMPLLEKFLGRGFFKFPDPDTLPTGRKPEDLDYTNARKFMLSVAEGAPDSYVHWLYMNQFNFRVDFLPRTFPGWRYDWPAHVEQDIKEVQEKSPYRTTASGLLVPRNPQNPTFAETLNESRMLEDIDVRGAFIRMRDGYNAAPDSSYFARHPRV